MKPQNIVVAVVLIAAIAAGAWYFMQPAAPPEKVADAPKAATPAAATTPPAPAPKPTPPPPTPAPVVVAKPVMAPMSAPAAKPADTASAPATAPAGNPQADLSTAIPDVARLMRSGDFATLTQTYAPPDKLANMTPEDKQQMAMVSAMAQSPDMKPMFDALADTIDGLKDQTPTYNDAKDEATYMLAPPAGMAPPNTPPQPVTFVKINGQWYMKDGPGSP